MQSTLRSWRQDVKVRLIQLLKDKVALVAGATRGGRGMDVELGAARRVTGSVLKPCQFSKGGD